MPGKVDEINKEILIETKKIPKNQNRILVLTADLVEALHIELEIAIAANDNEKVLSLTKQLKSAIDSAAIIQGNENEHFRIRKVANLLLAKTKTDYPTLLSAQSIDIAKIRLLNHVLREAIIINRDLALNNNDKTEASKLKDYLIKTLQDELQREKSVLAPDEFTATRITSLEAELKKLDKPSVAQNEAATLHKTTKKDKDLPAKFAQKSQSNQIVTPIKHFVTRLSETDLVEPKAKVINILLAPSTRFTNIEGKLKGFDDKLTIDTDGNRTIKFKPTGEGTIRDLLVDPSQKGYFKLKEKIEFNVQFDYIKNPNLIGEFNSIGLIQVLLDSERKCTWNNNHRLDVLFKKYPVLDGSADSKEDFLWYALDQSENGFKKANEITSQLSRYTLRLEDDPSFGVNLHHSSLVKEVKMKESFLIILCECYVHKIDDKVLYVYFPADVSWKWNYDISWIRPEGGDPVAGYSFGFLEEKKFNWKEFSDAFSRFDSKIRCNNSNFPDET